MDCINRPRFLRIVYEAGITGHNRYNIGTYKEKTLHRVLKDYFTVGSAAQEVPIDRFVADIRNEGEIIEIQTSTFSAMRDKLEVFLQYAPVTIVYPIAQKKWTVWVDPKTGEFHKKNRSPKKGTPIDILPELFYIKQFLHHENLTIRTVLLEVEEYRLLNGQRSKDRKRGSERMDRIPTDIFGIYDLRMTDDYIALLPIPREVTFTAKELCSALKCRLGGRQVSAMLHTLEEVGAIVRDGKRGNAFLYHIPDRT